MIVAQGSVEDVGLVAGGHDPHVGLALVWAFVTGVELNVQLGVGVVDVAVWFCFLDPPAGVPLFEPGHGVVSTELS